MMDEIRVRGQERRGALRGSRWQAMVVGAVKRKIWMWIYCRWVQDMTGRDGTGWYGTGRDGTGRSGDDEVCLESI